MSAVLTCPSWIDAEFTVFGATITAAARTVLDDTTVDLMLATLGGIAAQGSGAIVRATSPALTTPNLGTPSALVLTNATAIRTHHFRV
jgi:hypothetical protein